MCVRPFRLTVGAFVHKQQNAFFGSNFSQTLKIELVTVDWAFFKTPVTRID
jgi:hypothetical protein